MESPEKFVDCDRNLCPNKVPIFLTPKDVYGRQFDKSQWSLVSTSGYRCCRGCSVVHYFCSQECNDFYQHHNLCYMCHESSGQVFVEELGYSLCTSRGDYNPSCLNIFQLEKKFQNLEKMDFKIEDNMLATHCNIPYRDLNSFEQLYKVMKQNDNKLSLEFLKNMLHFYNHRELPSGDISTSNVLKCKDCKKKNSSWGILCYLS